MGPVCLDSSRFIVAVHVVSCHYTCIWTSVGRQCFVVVVAAAEAVTGMPQLVDAGAVGAAHGADGGCWVVVVVELVLLVVGVEVSCRADRAAV